MKRAERYGIRSLEKDFPTDEVCLDFLFDARHNRQCSCGGTYKLRAGRKQYQCSKCRFHIAPTANTIFHKSDTSMQVWFKAVLAFSNAKSGISAKELERQLEVTYKTAWRMLTLIRKALDQKNGDRLKGIVEVDSAFFGGKGRSGKDYKHHKEILASKSVVIGAIERGGKVRAQVVADSTAETHDAFLDANVENRSFLMTDTSKAFLRTGRHHEHHTVNHSKGEFARGPFHVNSVETFWAHVKRSIKGTHKVVSKHHLQEYLNGFVFHYNNRYSDKERFALLLGILLQPVK